ncbi:MAG: hypothetical protein JSS86_25440 [Cyanobacteria bacterium SZAS LIN-2]|nr:hypothetical protein [Cyanobacteria bacterium SZAS LIN-2]
MIVPTANYLTTRQQKLLVSFIILILGPMLLFRLVVNPQFLTTYFLESTIANENLALLRASSMMALKVICCLAPGTSKEQVLALVGAPRFKEKKLNFPGCHQSLTKADEVWFYEIAPHALVLVCFQGDHCYSARTFEGREDLDYTEWKVGQIKTRGIGMTQKELEAWLGNCFVENPEFVRMVLTATGNRHSSKTAWTDHPGDFYTSSGSVIVLEMREGRCISAESYGVFY